MQWHTAKRHQASMARCRPGDWCPSQPAPALTVSPRPRRTSSRWVAPLVVAKPWDSVGDWRFPRRCTTVVANIALLLQVAEAMPAVHCSRAVIPTLAPKQLADSLRCLAQQNNSDHATVDALAEAVMQRLPHFGAPELSTTLWSLAMLKYVPSAAWWQDFEFQAYRVVTDFTDRQVRLWQGRLH
jgi:hypothetical protein